MLFRSGRDEEWKTVTNSNVPLFVSSTISIVRLLPSPSSTVRLFLYSNSMAVNKKIRRDTKEGSKLVSPVIVNWIDLVHLIWFLSNDRVLVFLG